MRGRSLETGLFGRSDGAAAFVSCCNSEPSRRGFDDGD
jgi:hypothetical protein